MAVRFIGQRTPTDCNLCAIAMALGLTYGKAMALVPDEDVEALDNTGMDNAMEDRILAAGGLSKGVDYIRYMPGFHLITSDFCRAMLWGRRAIISVTSKNLPDGMHAIYWDGEHLHDPSRKEKYLWTEVHPVEMVLFNEVGVGS